MCIYVAGVFATNLRSLLLTPPLAQYLERGATDYLISPAEKKKKEDEEEEELVVCGVDPGFSHGHKVTT